MQVHDNALNLTSELRKKRTLNVQYFFMKIHASAWQCIESHIWTKKKVDFESSILFHENSCKCMTMHWISHLNYEKSELWKFNIFSWKFMQGHDNALNLTSELRKKVNFESSIFFYENSCKCIESHIWTKKKVDFESSILFHENSCKCMTMHWISHLKYEKSELWKFNIFSWIFMQVHWISHLN
jgi:hypothetical protein